MLCRFFLATLEVLSNGWWFTLNAMKPGTHSCFHPRMTCNDVNVFQIFGPSKKYELYEFIIHIPAIPNAFQPERQMFEL